MADTVSELARRLADNAEAVCRHYLSNGRLSNGRREGRYWLVGDVHNSPGRSLYVRLHGPPTGKGAAGRWRDAATGEHGDLLDLIGATRGLDDIGAVLDEARRFLGLVRSMPSSPSPAPAGAPDAARRLFQIAKPIAGTLASTYLMARGIMLTDDMPSLRFHPRCWYRHLPASPDDARDAWPALIAAVTDLDGVLTAVQRTWLDPSGQGKAPVATPRRAMGHLLGNAVRFGVARDVMAAGEGIETMLSLRRILPGLPLAAALSAAHLTAIRLSPALNRLYVVHDNDPAGRRAAAALTARVQLAGIEALTLAPVLGDFNDDLRQLGSNVLAATLRSQLAPEDVSRFWRPPERNGQGSR
jgi:hypothetical protein